MVAADEDANAKSLERNLIRKKLEYFEDILPYIGDFGKYQWTLLLCIFPFGIAFIAVFIAPLLIVAVPQKHWCKINELMDLNLTQNQRIKLAFPESKQYPFYDRCHHKKLNFRKIIDQVGIEFDSKKWETNETVKCEEWEYDFSLISYPSIGVEMNWVCDEEYRIATAQAVFFIGLLLGNFIFGWIADRKGRLLTLKLCTSFAFVATIGTANANNFWTFALCRFILGFAFDNILTVPVIIALEYTTERKRYYITCLGFGLSLITGKLLLIWSAYFISNWRIFTYLCSLPFLICFFLTFVEPESIRWYISQGLSEKILKRLRKIAKVNGTNPKSWIYDEFFFNLTSEGKYVESVNFWDIRKTPHLAKNTLLFSFIFALTAIILDTQLYYLHRYELSIFLSFTWLTLETFLTCVLFKFIINYLGRRFSGSSYLLFIMIFSCAFFVVESDTVKMFMASICRFGMSCLNFLFIQYTPEFFPTTLRTQGSALVHFLATMMHFITPYIMLLEQKLGRK